MAFFTTKMSLKLLVDNKTNKVLFAEAGKNFVFSLLKLPIGAVPKLALSGRGTMDGSVGRLYQSVDRMGAPYMQPGADKSELLQPMVPPPAGRRRGGRLQQLLARLKLYTCPGRCVTMTMDAGADCPQCRQPMAEEMAYVPPKDYGGAGVGAAGPVAASDESGGYVKGLVTYFVTDGLEVTPMSVTASIRLIRRFRVGKDVVDLAEKIVDVGMFEGLALLNAVLSSDTVLSDVFLAGKK